MEDERSKTANILLISQNMKDLKERMEKNDDRLRDVEDISKENKFNHQNTHEKLDTILQLCGKTDTRIRIVEDTILEHKTKVKLIGSLAGIMGGGIALAAKVIWENITNPKH